MQPSRHRLALLLLPVTVIAATVMTLAAPATGPSAPGGSAKTQSIQAAPVVGAAATVRAISHNMCGGQCKAGSNNGIAELESAINAYNPQLLMLQEVCLSQYNTLQTYFATKYVFAYTKLLGNYSSCGASPNNEIGQVVAVEKNSLGTPTVVDIPLGGESYQPEVASAPRRFHAICLDTKLTDVGTARNVLACSVHLRAFDDSLGVNVRARNAQAATLASELDKYIAGEGKAVIVGGDFNAAPGEASMSPMYRLSTPSEGGYGTFEEADQDTPTFLDSYCASATVCRSGEATYGSWDKRNSSNVTTKTSKIDYIFFSDVADSASVSALPVSVPWSDHAVYRGQASVSTTTP